MQKEASSRSGIGPVLAGFLILAVLVASNWQASSKRPPLEKDVTQNQELTLFASKPQIVADVLPQQADSVLPLIYTNAPKAVEISVARKKQIFLDTMLPAVLSAARLQEKLAARIRTLQAKDSLEVEEEVWLDSLRKRYHAKSDSVLLFKLIPPPHSLVLAQAALESGWGSSRFYQEACNAFGVWGGRSGKRIASKGLRDGKPVYLRAYDNLLEAVLDYHAVLARGPYASFRKVKARGASSLELTEHLDRYSEKGKDYGRSLKALIRFNHLQKLDSARLVLDWSGPDKAMEAEHLVLP